MHEYLAKRLQNNNKAPALWKLHEILGDPSPVLFVLTMQAQRNDRAQ
jgi:hypothetical protein